jgi:hypothetical protein
VANVLTDVTAAPEDEEAPPRDVGCHGVFVFSTPIGAYNINGD